MIGERLNNAINEQIKNELESYYIYLSMAAWLHSRVIDRAGEVVLQDLKQLKTQWSSPLEVFRDAYEHEKFITGKINDLTTIAREEKDYASEPMLAWFSEEQTEEEAVSSKVTDELTMVGDDKSGLLMLDRELGGRAYPAGSPLDSLAGSGE